jgi:two-component system CheB/CheR fusion protein
MEESLSEKAEGDVYRAWVVGCSTGEEAYSVATMLNEKLEKLGKKMNLQIFAIDLDAEAIDKVRRGIYPITSILEMDAHLLKKYFSHEAGALVGGPSQASRPEGTWKVFC